MTFNPKSSVTDTDKFGCGYNSSGVLQLYATQSDVANNVRFWYEPFFTAFTLYWGAQDKLYTTGGSSIIVGANENNNEEGYVYSPDIGRLDKVFLNSTTINISTSMPTTINSSQITAFGVFRSGTNYDEDNCIFASGDGDSVLLEIWNIDSLFKRTIFGNDLIKLKLESSDEEIIDIDCFDNGDYFQIAFITKDSNDDKKVYEYEYHNTVAVSVKDSLTNKYANKIQLETDSENDLTFNDVETSADDVIADVTIGSFENNSRYVLVQENGKVRYSSDGESWIISANQPTTSALRGVSFGKRRFVAVGSDGVVRNSADGINWTTTGSSGSSDTLWSVVYGDLGFVAVGFLGRISHTADGITWTTEGRIGSNTLYGVGHNNGRYVAVGNNGAVVRSDNLTSWTTVSGINSNFQFRDVKYCYNIWIAVGYENNDSVIIYSEDNGVTWSNAAITGSKRLRSVIFAKDLYIATGDDGITFHSRDGKRWTQVSDIGTTLIRNSAYLNGKVFLCNQTSELSISEPYFRFISTNGYIVTSLIRHQNLSFVLKGDKYKHVVGTNVDVENSLLDYELDYKYARFRLNAGGFQQNFSVRNKNAISFTDMSNTGVFTPITLRFFDGRYFAVSPNEITTSTDGINWTAITNDIGSFTAVSAISFQNGRYVFLGRVGNDAYSFYSYNGVNFFGHYLQNSNINPANSTNNEKFIVSRITSNFYASDDGGTNWFVYNKSSGGGGIETFYTNISAFSNIVAVGLSGHLDISEDYGLTYTKYKKIVTGNTLGNVAVGINDDLILTSCVSQMSRSFDEGDNWDLNFESGDTNHIMRVNDTLYFADSTNLKRYNKTTDELDIVTNIGFSVNSFNYNHGMFAISNTSSSSALRRMHISGVYFEKEDEDGLVTTDLLVEQTADLIVHYNGEDIEFNNVNLTHDLILNLEKLNYFIKYYNGISFTPKPLLYYNGVSWEPVTSLKRWNGSAWVTL